MYFVAAVAVQLSAASAAVAVQPGVVSAAVAVQPGLLSGAVAVQPNHHICKNVAASAVAVRGRPRYP